MAGHQSCTRCSLTTVHALSLSDSHPMHSNPRSHPPTHSSRSQHLHHLVQGPKKGLPHGKGRGPPPPIPPPSKAQPIPGATPSTATPSTAAATGSGARRTTRSQSRDSQHTQQAPAAQHAQQGGGSGRRGRSSRASYDEGEAEEEEKGALLAGYIYVHACIDSLDCACC